MSKSTLRQERAAQAAAQLAAQKRQQRKRSAVAIGGVIVAMAIVIGGGVWLGQRGGNGDVSASGAGDSSYGVTIGKPSAPHKVVIYEDFLCPYCGELEKTSHEKLAQLADQGKVYVDYRPFILLDRLGPYSELATNAFAVVQQESGDTVAKKFHDLLYANQPSEEGPFPQASDLVKLAVQAGAKESAVSDGITQNSQKSWTEGATKEATDAGVQGTPTILLDGQSYQKGSNVDEMAQNLIEDVS